MGLFDKKFCDICGEKVNMLTQQKLSDGFLCSDCKHKLCSFTSGWKQRTVDDVKRHLELREQNKQKYQQFNCSATAGDSGSSIKVDFNNQWFFFDINNRDNKNGNPQIFDFSQLQDFWLEQEYRTLTDSDQDGIPDIRDKFDNRQPGNQNNSNFFMNNQMYGNMQTNVMNVPFDAQPFLRNIDSSYLRTGGIKEVSGIKACFKVTDPYITDDISFTVAYVGSNNHKQLMQAYELGVQIMQLCQQMKQSGAQHNAYGQNDFVAFDVFAPKTREQEIMVNFIKEFEWLCKFCHFPNMGTLTCSHCGETVSDEGVLELAKKFARGELLKESFKINVSQDNSVPMQQSVPQSWNCPSCGGQNSGKFCENCGTPKP